MLNSQCKVRTKALFVIGSKCDYVDLVRQINMSFGYPHYQVIAVVTRGGGFACCAAGKGKQLSAVFYLIHELLCKYIRLC